MACKQSHWTSMQLPKVKKKYKKLTIIVIAHTTANNQRLKENSLVVHFNWVKLQKLSSTRVKTNKQSNLPANGVDSGTVERVINQPVNVNFLKQQKKKPSGKLPTLHQHFSIIAQKWNQRRRHKIWSLLSTLWPEYRFNQIAMQNFILYSCGNRNVYEWKRTERIKLAHEIAAIRH